MYRIATVLGLAVAARAASTPLDTLRSRMVANLVACSQDICEDAATTVKNQLANGSWASVNYKDNSRNNWAPVQHWYLMKPVAMALHCSCSQPSQTDLVSSLHKAQTFWYAGSASGFIVQSTNWWWPDIGEPMAIAAVDLLFYEYLTSEEINNASLIFLNADWQKGGGTWSGQNAQWGQQIEAWRGVISSNTTAVDEAFSAMWAGYSIVPAKDVQSVDGNGIVADGSFHQHGQLLQTGTYGAGYSGDALSLVPLVSGLPWDVSEPGRSVLLYYLLEGQRPTVRWNGATGESLAMTWDVSVKGREITRPPSGSCSFDTTWASGLKQLAPAGNNRHDDAQAWAATMEGSGAHTEQARHFWNSDYLAVATDAFSASVRMHSKRTFSSECVNDENLQGWHQSEGFVSVRRLGDEFSRDDSIFPVWNYTLLPGVTTRQVQDEEQCGKVKQLGTATFVGGAADGVAGTAAFHQVSDDDGGAQESTRLTARKSYLSSAAVGGVVVMADDAALATDQAVATTLTSAMLPPSGSPSSLGPVVATSAGGAAPAPDGEHTFAAGSVAWVASDGVAIAPIPVGGSSSTSCTSNVGGQGAQSSAPVFADALYTRTGTVNGSWHRISTSQSDATVHRGIFTAALAHGSLAHPKTFAYVVLAGNVSASEAPSAVSAAQQALRASVCGQGSNGVGAVHSLHHTDSATGLRTLAVAAFPSSTSTHPPAALERGSSLRGEPRQTSFLDQQHQRQQSSSSSQLELSSVSHPSSWLVREAPNGKLIITVSDPTNTAGSSPLNVTATLNGLTSAPTTTTRLSLLGGTAVPFYANVLNATEWEGAGGSCGSAQSGGASLSVSLPAGSLVAGAAVTFECAVASAA